MPLLVYISKFMTIPVDIIRQRGKSHPLKALRGLAKWSELLQMQDHHSRAANIPNNFSHRHVKGDRLRDFSPSAIPWPNSNSLSLLMVHLKVTFLERLCLFRSEVDIFISPLSTEVLANEGVVKNVSRSIKNKFKIYIYLQTLGEKSHVVNFVIFPITHRQRWVR